VAYSYSIVTHTLERMARMDRYENKLRAAKEELAD